MAIETAAQIRHHVDGQNTYRDAALGTQPILQPGSKIEAAGERRGKSFRRRLDPSEISRPALQRLAHLVQRQPVSGDRCMSFRHHQRRQIGQPCRLLAIGAIELDHAARGIGCCLGHLHQFLIARQLARQQRIDKDLLELIETAAGLPPQFLEIDPIDACKLEKELHRQRTLVALDQVQVGR